MNKSDFETLLASLKEAVAISKGEMKAAETIEIDANPKEIREKLSLTQREFAQFVGVKENTLKNWEQGRRKIPATARRLMRIAGTHPEIILEITKP